MYQCCSYVVFLQGSGGEPAEGAAAGRGPRGQVSHPLTCRLIRCAHLRCVQGNTSAWYFLQPLQRSNLKVSISKDQRGP